MMDLIAYGLALREKLKTSTEIFPQVIRIDSADSIPCLLKESAISAESAIEVKINQTNGYCNEFKMDRLADIADSAEGHSGQGKFIADDLRKNCGLKVRSKKMTDDYQEKSAFIPIKLLCDCGYRPPFCSCGLYKFRG